MCRGMGIEEAGGARAAGRDRGGEDVGEEEEFCGEEGEGGEEDPDGPASDGGGEDDHYIDVTVVVYRVGEGGGHGESLAVTGHWRRNQGEDETWLWGAKSEWYVPGTVHRNLGQGRARRDRS